MLHRCYVLAPSLCLKVAGRHTTKQNPGLHTNSHCQQCMIKDTHVPNITVWSIIRNSRKLSACANSRFQVLFSDFLKGPRNKAYITYVCELSSDDWCYFKLNVHSGPFFQQCLHHTLMTLLTCIHHGCPAILEWDNNNRSLLRGSA